MVTARTSLLRQVRECMSEGWSARIVGQPRAPHLSGLRNRAPDCVLSSQAKRFSHRGNSASSCRDARATIPGRGVHCSHGAGRPFSLARQDRLPAPGRTPQSAIGAEIVVVKAPAFARADWIWIRWPAEFDERDFLEEPPQHLDAVAALNAFAPRFEELRVVMVVRRDLEFARRLDPRPSPRRRACADGRFQTPLSKRNCTSCST